jgi:hypothetical protein
VGVVGQRASQAGNDLAQAVVLDHETWPQRQHQGIFVEQFARMFHEQKQRAEQPGREAQDTAVAMAHLLPRPLQHEITEGIAWRWRHGATSDFFRDASEAANDFQGKSGDCDEVRSHPGGQA